MKIERMEIGALRNEAHFQFHTEIKNAIQEFGAEPMRISAQYQAYLQLYANMDAALKKIIKSSYTKRIQEADKARDETWGGFADAVKAVQRHPGAAKKLAADRIRIVMDTYGNVARKTLNEETAAIYNIVQDFESPRYAADIAEIGAGFWVEELKLRNEAFSSLVNQRYDETADRCDIALREARLAADRAYREILKYIEAFILAYGEEAYAPFARKHNAIIAKYEATTGHSKAKKGNGQGEEEGA